MCQYILLFSCGFVLPFYIAGQPRKKMAGKHGHGRKKPLAQEHTHLLFNKKISLKT
jgi:hypothetical protein